MKKITLLLISYLICFSCMAQCDDAFLDNCATKLNGNTFLKAYKINPSEQKSGKPVEYSYVFSKDTYYYLSICSDAPENLMIVNLFDKNKRIIATSFDKRTGKHYPALSYKCMATDVYYLSFEFENNSGCGVGVLGFQESK